MRAAAGAIKDALLYYGGEYVRPNRQRRWAGADTIVVGNAVYEEGIEVLRATVRAVH